MALAGMARFGEALVIADAATKVCVWWVMEEGPLIPRVCFEHMHM